MQMVMRTRNASKVDRRLREFAVLVTLDATDVDMGNKLSILNMVVVVKVVVVNECWGLKERQATRAAKGSFYKGQIMNVAYKDRGGNLEY